MATNPPIKSIPRGPRWLISISLLLIVPFALRDCVGGPDSRTSTQEAADRMTAVAGTDTARAATQDAYATREAAPIFTRIAAQLTLQSKVATPTDIFAIGATPEAAALDTLKAWATVPYQNEQAVALSKTDQRAHVQVSAEFKDSGTGAWVRKEATTDCGKISAGWKCVPEFNFKVAATATATPTGAQGGFAAPTSAALNNFHAWAAKNAVSYRNERAEVLSTSGILASVRVTAELQDAGTKAWVAQQAPIDCKQSDAGWECTTYFTFLPVATPTPRPK